MSLILNLVYLCYFRSSISDFWSCSSPLSRLANAIGLTQFGFFKRELYPISHNALIMDCFSRAHLYGVPCITVSSFGSKIDREKRTDYALSTNIYIIPIQYLERELWRIYQGHFYLRWISEACKNPDLHRSYLQKYYATWSEIVIAASSGFRLHLIKISASKPS